MAQNIGTSSNTGIVKSVIDSEIKYLTIHEQRAKLVSQIRGRNVQFKDVEQFLLKEARREGYYSDESHLKMAKEQKLAWLIYLTRFIIWVKKTYKPDWSERMDMNTGRAIKNPSDPKKTVTKVSERRAEKLLEVPENVEALTTALINQGKRVFNKILTESQVEMLLEDEENLQRIIKALRDMAYQVN